ncbi:hypothetical protein NL676_039281 [Syzygium grande]|nr:hypothetical protein NL676_039281 [Syzygium grande]
MCGGVAERPVTAKDVYDVIMERVSRGWETSLKEILDELRRRIDELEGENRELESWPWVWGKKYKDLDRRILHLERDASM